MDLAKKFISTIVNSVFRFKFGASKSCRMKLAPADESLELKAKSSGSCGFFVPFSTGKSATLGFDSSGLSTASLIGFGNSSCEHTKIVKNKGTMKLFSLKNHLYFPIPASCRLKKIVASFSAYEVNINSSIDLFPCVYIAKSKGVGKPFELLESTKTSAKAPLKNSASCLKLQEVFAISNNLKIDFDFSDRVAICLTLEAKGKITDRSTISLLCSGSLLFG